MTDPREVVVPLKDLDLFFRVRDNHPGPKDDDRYRAALQAVIARRVPDVDPDTEPAKNDDVDDIRYAGWACGHNACRNKVLKGV